MPDTTVAIVATGAMGAGIGGALVLGGVRVVTNLDGRSDESRERAARNGMEDLGDDAAVADAADIFLSILPPADAVALAKRMAAAAPSSGHAIYVDCNAIAPQTMAEVERVLVEAGYPVVDGGIIGGPAREGYSPGVYVSGAVRGEVLALNGHGVNFRDAGGGVGDASALKLCYAALTKGMSALFIEAATAAAAYGVDDLLAAEWTESQDALTRRLGAGAATVHGKAARFVGEMREMATAFGAVGIPPSLSHGLGDLYQAVADARDADPALTSLDHPELTAALARVLKGSD